VLVRSRTGYERRFPIGDASSIVVATGVGGAQLSAGHGFPARLVAPGRRGYWWVKWIDEIRVDDTPWWWQPPFPLT
jgi:DMSO/TMAO reductase YedYZ molybdopterin-dependent catalytic subunit